MAELKHGEPCVQQPQKQIYAKFKTIFLFINFINSKRRLKHVTHISPPLSLALSLSSVTQWSLVNLLASNINLSGVFFPISFMRSNSFNQFYRMRAQHTHHHQTSTYQKVAHKNFNRTHSLSHSHNKVLNYKSFSVGSTRKKHEKEKNRARAILYVERTITVNCEMNTKCLGPCNFWSLCKCETMASI